MADRKITDLTALTTPASADVLPIVDVSEAAAADKNKKVTVGELFKGIPDGTAAAPAIAFESDDGNGFFLSTTDTIGIATNGVSRATVSTTAVTSTLPISATAFSPTSATVPTNGVYLPATNSVGIATNGSVALTIDSSQRLGVGTASPQSLIDLNHATAPDFRFGVGGTTQTNFYANSFNTTLTTTVANPLIFGTNNSERLRITSAGLVGIGSSTPGALLHIEGGDAILKSEYSASGTTDALLYLSNRDGGNWRNGYIGLTGAGNITFANGGTGTDPTVAGTAKVTLDTSGRLGIGTTSPSYPLQVDTTGTGTAAGDNTSIYIQSQASGRDCNIRFGDSVNASARIGYLSNNLYFYVNGSERGRWDSSGRLLVGTSSSPSAGTGQYALSVVQGYAGSATGEGIVSIARGKAATAMVNTDTIGQILFTDNAGNTFAKIFSFVDGTVSSTSDLPGALAFSTTADGASSPTERVRITSSGYFKASTLGGVYIGATAGHHEFVSNTNGQYTLHVQSNAETSNQYGLQIRTSADQNDSTRLFLNCVGDTTQRAAFRTNGGLANYSANNANLSDRNAKKDISPAAGTWNCIKEWEIVNYRYKDQPDDADLNLGVIAQQVAESCPEVITVFQEAQDAKPAVLDDEGNEVEAAQAARPERLGVKEQQMYWMAIKALQEAQVRIEALEAEVAALKAQ